MLKPETVSEFVVRQPFGASGVSYDDIKEWGGLAVTGMTLTLEGFIVRPLKHWECGVLIFGGVLALFPSLWFKIDDLVLMAGAYAFARRK